MAPVVYFTINKTTTATAHEGIDIADLWEYSLSELMEHAIWEEIEDDVEVVAASEPVPD